MLFIGHLGNVHVSGVSCLFNHFNNNSRVNCREQLYGGLVCGDTKCDLPLLNPEIPTESKYIYEATPQMPTPAASVPQAPAPAPPACPNGGRRLSDGSCPFE